MKNLSLKPILIIICIVLFSSLNSFGQATLKAKLLKDIVKNENGKFTLEEYGFIVTLEANLLEVKVTSVAPSNLISRDNFISVSSSMANAILASTLKSKGITGNDDLHLNIRDKQIAPADITIQIELNPDGLTYKVNAKGYQGSNNLGWDQFFFEKSN
jgi:phage tail sheath gpL-like